MAHVKMLDRVSQTTRVRILEDPVENVDTRYQSRSLHQGYRSILGVL